MAWTLTANGWTYTTEGGSGSPMYGGALIQGASIGRRSFWSAADLRAAKIDPAAGPDARWNDLYTAGEYVRECVPASRLMAKGRTVC